MSLPVSPVAERRTTSADGTQLTYYVLGSGPRVWLAPPAMGAPLVSMRRLYEGVGGECTIVTWDMRGFYRSGAPVDPRAYGLDRHVEDLEAVVRAEGLSRFVLGGWSMGVPISLEYFSRAAASVEALVLINGPYESALAHILPSQLLARAVMAAVDVVGGPVGRLMNPALAHLLGRPGVADAFVRVGLFARDPAYFEEILRDFRSVDWPRYLVVMRLLHEHSVAEVLRDVRVPTLITAGTKDMLVPLSTARHMHRQIQGSELLVVEGGTHYTPAEYPELLAERIRRFLAERVWATAPFEAGAGR